MLFCVSDAGSDSSDSDGPPVHLMEKVNGKKVSSFYLRINSK